MPIWIQELIFFICLLIFFGAIAAIAYVFGIYLDNE